MHGERNKLANSCFLNGELLSMTTFELFKVDTGIQCIQFSNIFCTELNHELISKGYNFLVSDNAGQPPSVIFFLVSISFEDKKFFFPGYEKNGSQLCL